MCIRDRYQRRVRGPHTAHMARMALPNDVAHGIFDTLPGLALANVAQTCTCWSQISRAVVKATCAVYGSSRIAEEHNFSTAAREFVLNAVATIKRELALLASLIGEQTSFRMEACIHRLRGLLGGDAQGGGMLVACGAVDLLVDLLRVGDVYGKGHAIYSLAQLAAGSDVRCAAIVEAGGVSLLVQAIGCDDRHVRGSAAYAIMQLAISCPRRADEIVAAGAIEPLVNLLMHGDGFGKGGAAYALAQLPVPAEHQALLADVLLRPYRENVERPAKRTCLNSRVPHNILIC
eukprot:TRINITY_DN179_c0_g2_i1.p1 TRINITY_DN179_c0_g2~~TRINITY_DN179_c0_g2_i1.p1  ORF type:complete len:290 (-),score=74.13 TRINITY_DN179_c0_g2_i1:146-1015(-)